MKFLDARRLTGPNVLSDLPGSILDVSCADSDVQMVVKSWHRLILPMLDALGWGNESTYHKPLAGGVSLAFSAPIDVLYAAAMVNEWAWQHIETAFEGERPGDFEQAVVEIRQAIEEEQNPALLALQQAAREHQVPFLWDDDEVSVGFGRGSQTWSIDEIPDADELDWQRYHGVPVGIVTGTNGKTTTVRLSTFILQGAGKQVGVSCTDWVAVNDNLIDRGDWSGPGGARMVLRQPTVDVAVLEAARGGLLRRGLGVERADAALLTNIAEDHLGDFGSSSLGELLDIKWVISRAVKQHGNLILNADDALLVEKMQNYPGKVICFSLDENNPYALAQLANGGEAFVLSNDQLIRLSGTTRDVICHVAEIPITLGGAARHNIANSLAAAALTYQLGASLDDIRNGLKSMDQAHNPGRCNLYEVGDVRVLVDFAHNPHAMQALFTMAEALPAKRRLLSFGQAGDRTDQLIRELARLGWAIGLDAVHVSELEMYHRGRNHGEVYALIKDELLICGARDDQIKHFELEIDALESALAWSQPGDLIIMLALGHRSLIQQRLQELSDSSS